MTEGARPGQGQAASIAWAVAVTVVALVGGGLVYLAMQDGDGGSADSGAAAPATVTRTVEATPPQPAAGEAPAADRAAGTLSPQEEQYVLDLARRDPADPLAMGDPDAPVVIIEYADYRCPFCARWSLQTLPELQDRIDDGTVRLEFRDTPIFGEPSEQAAVAARAAGEQGRYWEYSTRLYESHGGNGGHPEWSREDLVRFAEEAGVADLERFEADLDSEALRRAVSEDTAEARSLGIRSTPTFLVNTIPVRGAQPVEVFERAIEAALADAGS